MTNYVTFEASIETMHWGKSTYTVLPLSEETLIALGHPKRVEGELNEHPVNLAIVRAPVIDRPFMWTGKNLLKRIGVEPGTLFEARLRPVDPDQVEIPRDVLHGLRSSGLLEAWESLSAGKRRNLLAPVEQAKRAETRANRITKMLAQLT